MKMGGSVLAFTSVVSTLGGLLFGYELGIISGALLQLQKEFHFSCLQQEAVVSALLIGALLASVFGGVLIDRHGRRNSIMLSNLLILGGSLLLLVSGSVFVLAAGRITVGLAMSLSSMSCCIFVSEIVSPKRRGLMVTLYEAGITVGILTAYAMSYVLSDIKQGWKYMFGFAIAPSLVQFVSIWFLPSKPGISVKPETQSQTGLIQFTSASEMDDGAVNIDGLNDQQNSILTLFQSKDNMRTRMLIGLSLVFFQQFTGQPNVLFYASTIFHSVGFQSEASAMLASVGLGAVKVIATLVSMILADKVGRRALLIGGCIVMTLSVIIIGIFSNHPLHSTWKHCDSNDLLTNRTSGDYIVTPSNTSFYQTHGRFEKTMIRGNTDAVLGHSDVSQENSFHSNTKTLSPDAVENPITFKSVDHGVVTWIILISMMAYVSAYSVGFGPMTWLVLSEIFPARVRGRAFALTNCFNWAANFIVTFSFLNLIDALGLSLTFLLYGLVGVVAVVSIYFLLPETKGKSLEEIDKELSRKRLHNRCDRYCVWKRRIYSSGYQRVHLTSSTIE